MCIKLGSCKGECPGCNTRRARLDADRTAKPLSRIVSHPPRAWCSGPGTILVDPEYELPDGVRLALT